uniref:Ferredoxin n=1 Tax=Candidatus Kentrum sp. DK TaxID=2126562 RepID=A0A450S4Z5_9GAMM|nr:MAG: Ferredoxin [Candidatus Kentron sp. DK]
MIRTISIPLFTQSDRTEMTSHPENPAVDTLSIGTDWTTRMDQAEIPLRVQPAKKVTSEDDTIRMLRGFYLGNPAVPEPEDAVDGRYLPAFLGPYRDGAPLRHDYPLFLADIDVANSPGHGVFPLPGFFNGLMVDFEQKSARLLEEHLVRLERHIVEAVAQGHGNTDDDGAEGEEDSGPQDAGAVLERATQALLASLHPGEAEREQLEAGLMLLREKLPRGWFLPFSRRAPLHILTHVAKYRFRTRHAETLNEVAHLATGLNALLEMDKAKSIEAIEPRMVLDSIGLGGERFLDPLALSDLMDHRHGSRTMSPERRQRIRETLDILEGERTATLRAPRLILIRSTGSGDVCGLPPGPLPPEFSGAWALHESSSPFSTAMTVFQEEAAESIRLARAMRIAALELENSYDPAVHDAWFAGFDWRALSEEEARLAPVVLVVDTGSDVAGGGLSYLSRLLHADRPIQVLLEVEPGVDPGGEDRGNTGTTVPGDSMDARTELSYLGFAHRQAVIVQSSVTRPRHLLTGFDMALKRGRPALHLLGSGYGWGEERVLPQSPWPWLLESAAVESRAHPLSLYDPATGGAWSIPLSLIDNPQPEADWPAYPFQYRAEDGAVTEVAMTFGFADYALLDARWWKHFYPVPDTLDAKEFLPLEEYLALAPDARGNRLPFLWAVHDDERTRGVRLRRLIVSAVLVEACLDRRAFWRALQAMAGVRSRHVEEAVSKVKARAEEQAEAQRVLLVTEHRIALEKTRKEAGSEALRRLTESLLSMDPLSMPTLAQASSGVESSGTSTAPSSAIMDVPAGNREGRQEVSDGGELAPESGGEPWIDTPLCTSCNECTDLNPRLFVYDDNKQAEIGDLSAGTREEWLQAAEICPAQCIHP